MNNKVAIVLPYYGEFPSYFDLWLNSAAYNIKFDFFIITDYDFQYETSDNIKILKLSLNDIKKRIDNEVGFKVQLNSPYKLCDYKPTYGAIFEDYLKGYTHWGYCDSDVIFGDLSHFITDDKLEKYDRIYDLGHLCIYKNNPENNRKWKTTDNLLSYNYKEVFRVKHCKMFDERGGMWDIWNLYGYSQYVNRTEIADIFPQFTRFQTWFSDALQYYEFINGKLIGHFIMDGKETSKEFAYIHLQKRKMIKEKIDPFHFYIIPNKFTMWIKYINHDQFVTTNSLVLKKNLIRKIKGCFEWDELIFHLRVAFRRCKNTFQGRTKGIKYKYF